MGEEKRASVKSCLLDVSISERGCNIVGAKIARLLVIAHKC